MFLEVMIISRMQDITRVRMYFLLKMGQLQYSIYHMGSLMIPWTAKCLQTTGFLFLRTYLHFFFYLDNFFFKQFLEVYRS